MFTDVAGALSYIKAQDVAMVDLKIVGVAGQWLHVTIPAKRLTREHFEEGVGYDGSSGSGFTSVENGDVVAVPEVGSAFLDPFWDRPTLSFLCHTVTADTRSPFRADPRGIARRASESLRERGVADEALMAPEFEFHIFDRVEVHNSPYHTHVRIESSEIAATGAKPVIPPRGGYFRTPPVENLHNIRSEIVLTLEEMGVPVKYHHHEVGACGQCEIELHPAPLLQAADHAMLIKYVVKNVAAKHGKLATFMPKPVHGEAGNGMHVHQHLETNRQPLFYDHRQNNYANLSDLALGYVGGLLSHGRALTALTNPSTNSFKRLVPGFEAPVRLFFSLANRSAAIRVPRYATTPRAKRIEYRPGDFTCNVYLALAAMLMAGLDGIESKIDPSARHFGPFDVDIARQGPEFLERIAQLPHSLHEATRALEEDHEFLLKGDVFPKSLLMNWIHAKRNEEFLHVAARPHPYEYELYLDA